MSEDQSAEVDRLSLDVTVQENDREEDAEAFESYITEMFINVYDEVSVSVTEADSAE